MPKMQKYPVMSALKGRIREENQTYRSLSNETGISVDAINSKLNGYSAINCDDVELLSEALHIQPDEILKYFFPHMLRNATKSLQ